MIGVNWQCKLDRSSRATVLLTGNLTNSCEWHVSCVCSARKSIISGTHVCTFTSVLKRLRYCTGTRASTCDLTAKMQLHVVKACLPLAVLSPPLFAKQTYWRSPRSLVYPRVEALLQLHVQVLETRHEKMRRVRSLSTPGGSYTASLCSTNSPTFIKRYRKHANRLLSRSCHSFASGAIIGLCLLCTCMSIHVHARVRVRARA